MLTALLPTLAVSLFLTLVLEGLFALLWGVRARRDWLVLLAVNCVTNPLVVLFHYRVCSSLPAVVCSELLAVLAEALAYRRWGRDTRPALLFSLCANCFSYFCGLLLNLAAPRLL